MRDTFTKINKTVYFKGAHVAYGLDFSSEWEGMPHYRVFSVLVTTGKHPVPISMEFQIALGGGTSPWNQYGPLTTRDSWKPGYFCLSSRHFRIWLAYFFGRKPSFPRWQPDCTFYSYGKEVLGDRKSNESSRNEGPCTFYLFRSNGWPRSLDTERCCLLW